LIHVPYDQTQLDGTSYQQSSLSMKKKVNGVPLKSLLGLVYWEFSAMKLGKTLFHIGTGADIRDPKTSLKITASILTPFSELLPNLYYSPIKKLENIFIFKIAR
jgi:hypothetical protein